ncbi:hypothetical protein CEB3_c39130 [Peptococcaceae bacterium CEB3]|nr:hypothetical protein CEB3_c39130 [Peptococcaceae bacterium CEB3]
MLFYHQPGCLDLKLNKRKYQELDYCKEKLAGVLKTFGNIQKFLICDLGQTDTGAIVLTWVWNEEALAQEEKYDGTFALLTNYPKEKVNMNRLVSKYRGRDQVEVDIKEMKGLLNLERILYQRPERIDTYVFLKVIALFVLTFLRSYTAREGVKTTERKLQESMGACSGFNLSYAKTVMISHLLHLLITN